MYAQTRASAIAPKPHPHRVKAVAILPISPNSQAKYAELVREKNSGRIPSKQIIFRDQFSSPCRTPNKSLAVKTPGGTILRQADINITIDNKPFEFFCSDIPSNPPKQTAIAATIAQNQLQQTLGKAYPHNIHYRQFQKRVNSAVVETAKTRGRPTIKQSEVAGIGANEYIQQIHPLLYHEIVNIFAQMKYTVDPFAWLHEIGCCIEDQNPQLLGNFTIGTVWANTIMTAIETAIVDAIFLQKVPYLDVNGYVEHQLLNGSSNQYTYLALKIVYIVRHPNGIELRAEISPYHIKKTTSANALLKYLAYAVFSGLIGDHGWTSSTNDKWLATHNNFLPPDMDVLRKNLFDI